MHTTTMHTTASDWVFAVNSWIAANALLIVTGTALLYLVLFYPACDGMAAAGGALFSFMRWYVALSYKYYTKLLFFVFTGRRYRTGGKQPTAI